MTLPQELNDGVQWRITLPKVPMPSDSSPIYSPNLLLLHLRLLFTRLKPDEISPSVLFTNPDAYIPNELDWEQVAEQTLALQRVGSGFHQFYSVNFNTSYFAELDCMIHSCITAIRYCNPYLARSSSSSNVSQNVTVHGSSSSLIVQSDQYSSSNKANKSRISTTITGVTALESENHNHLKSIFSFLPSRNNKKKHIFTTFNDNITSSGKSNGAVNKSSVESLQNNASNESLSEMAAKSGFTTPDELQETESDPCSEGHNLDEGGLHDALMRYITPVIINYK